MRVAALYDIHGNLPALEAVLDEIGRLKIDEIIVGGDVLLGPMPVECLDILFGQSIPVHFIMGNCDEAVLNFWRGNSKSTVPERLLKDIEWTVDQIEMHLTQIEKWLPMLSINHLNLGPLLFCHATPRSNDEIFTKHTKPVKLQMLFDQVLEDTIVCGHTHIQFDFQVDGKRIINAGSVGMPFGRQGAYWLLIGNEPELKCTNYDYQTAVKLVKQSDYPFAADFASNHILNPPTEDAMSELFRQQELIL